MSFTKTYHLLQKEVPATHQSVLAHIINYSQLHGGCTKANATMADELNISPRTVQRSVKWLAGHGYIKSNYRLNEIGEQITSRRVPTDKALAYVEKYSKAKRKKVIYESKKQELGAALLQGLNYLEKAGFGEEELITLKARGRQIINEITDRATDNVVHIETARVAKQESTDSETEKYDIGLQVLF